MSASTRLVDRETVARLLRMGDCIAEMERTLIEVSAGQSVNLQRQMIPQPEGNMFAIMGSALTAQSLVGSKVIVFPGQKAKENGTSQGIIPLFDGGTGALLAVVDGEGITGVRTAATSAAATKALARADASALAILGAGRLGRLHIEAICSVRPIATVYVWDIAPAATESCCAWADVYKRQGVRFYFPRYLLLPGAYGVPVVDLSYDQLKPYLAWARAALTEQETAK